MKIKTWNKVSEMLGELKETPYRIEVYEGTDYFRVEFYFNQKQEEIKK